MRIEESKFFDIGQAVNPLKKEDVKPFSETLKEFVADVNSQLQQGKLAEERIIKGDVNNFEELLAQIEKADISLRLITEIRNKALESYQEIMRMQV